MAKPPTDDSETVEQELQQQLEMAQAQLARYAEDFRETVRELRASERRFRGIVERSFDAILTMDAAGSISYASPAVERTTGFPAAELVGHHFHDFITAATLPEALAAFGRVLAGDIVEGLELEMVRQDGSTFTALVNGSPVLEANEVVGVQVLYQDITRRKQAEAALQDSEQKLRVVFDGAQDGILVADTQSRKFILSNRGIQQMLGYSNEELLQLGVDDIHPPEGLEYVKQQFARQARGEITLAQDMPILRKDGTVFYADINSSPLSLAGRQCLLGVFHDITERRRNEQALQRLNRALAALSSCNSILIHATSEPQLLEEMCRNIVSQGEYHLVWIGFVEHDAEKHVRPVASAGTGTAYIDSLHLSWANNEAGQGPTGRAVRAGTPQLVEDILGDPHYAPWRDEALKHGFASGIALPLKGEDGEAFGVLNIYAAESHAFDNAEVRLLQELADDLAFGVLTLRTRQERSLYLQQHLKSVEQLKEALVSAIRAMALTVEKRDPYTAGHQSRVADLAVAIAAEMGVDENCIEGLRLGAMIHDIGKIYVPAEILNRPGKLSEYEFGMIKSHPEVGYEIMKGVKFPWPVADMVLQHHERIDGSGYPRGLAGEAIILEARILAVADVVEAITAHRPYRAGRGLDIALAEIESGRGQIYDIAVADACLRLFREKGYTLPDIP